MEKKRLKIALVAHDARKQELIDWCRFNMDTLLNHDMVATGTTSKLIKEMFMENDYPSER
jgi:methylglyoxal synthase